MCANLKDSLTRGKVCLVGRKMTNFWSEIFPQCSFNLEKLLDRYFLNLLADEKHKILKLVLRVIKKNKVKKKMQHERGLKRPQFLHL